jgi:hypothetical protein
MTSKRRRKANAVDASFGVADDRYDRWLAYVFGREPPFNGDLWNIANKLPPFDATSSEIVGLIGRTMTRSGDDLARFSVDQVADGLTYIFNPLFSNYGRALSASDVPLATRVQAMMAAKLLYKECLEPRCAHCLGHLDQPGANRLNRFVYMWWDSPSLVYANRDVPEMVAAIIKVFHYTLGSSNEACVESALHGLGHSAYDLPDVVRPLIDHFLDETKDADLSKPSRGNHDRRSVSPALRAYARAARSGMIQ